MASGPVGITVGTPPYGFNVIPGSVRRIFATVTNGATNQVIWVVKSGSGTISSSTGSWIDVTAPATGSTCSVGGTTGAYFVSSATNFTIEAISVDDGTKKADTVFNVCNPAVQVSAIPFYRTLYANQAADIQSIVVGSVNQNVHWAIATQPLGGDGKLVDTTARDTVFTATVAGRYTLTTTSQADPSKVATAVMYVTGHAMPYKVTPNQTEPVDCTVDPAMSGQVYEVGPSQTFRTLKSVPFPTMAAGSTVRLHNEDTTGTNPTQYHEYVQIQQQGSMTQPIRMCGVPDSAGNLPIIDGDNATGRTDTSIYAAGYGLVSLHNPNYWTYYPAFNAATNIVIEGIHLRNAKTGHNYTMPDGVTQAAWGDFSSCIRINQGHDTAFVGNDMDTCGLGAFSAFNGNGGWGSSDYNALWEGNYIHNNGAVGSYGSHQMYLQAWGEVVQFNRIDNYAVGAFGSNLKSRGLSSVIRYNYMGDGAARQMDLVDVQDGPYWMAFAAYIYDSAATYPADMVAAEQEAWNSHFMYGNIYLNSTSSVPIHFAYDQVGNEYARKGNLYWYNNTFYEKLCATCNGSNWTLFDTSGGGGNFYSQVEWNTVQAFNNIIWMDNPQLPIFHWNDHIGFIGVAGKNLLPTNWGNNDQTGTSNSGWDTSHGTAVAYQNATNLASHLTGFNSNNLMTTSTIPFNTTSWALNSDVAGSTVVPQAICQMPARFSFLPNLGYAVPRIGSPNVGATDTVPELASMMTTLAGPQRNNTRYSNCR